MNKASAALPRPFTVNDIHVGTALFAVLVDHARDNPGQTVFYGDLLDAARVRFPEDAEVKRAVPIGIGMKLLFVQAFCEAHGYPNLACLAVNKGKRIPGVSYPGDWEREMREVAAFGWDAVKPELDAYALAVRPLRPIKRDKAIDIRWEHYKDNRAAYEPLSEIERDEIINILMSGVGIERAVEMVLEAKAGLA